MQAFPSNNMHTYNTWADTTKIIVNQQPATLKSCLHTTWGYSHQFPPPPPSSPSSPTHHQKKSNSPYAMSSLLTLYPTIHSFGIQISTLSTASHAWLIVPNMSAWHPRTLSPMSSSLLRPHTIIPVNPYSLLVQNNNKILIWGRYGHTGKCIQENLIFMRFCCCFKLEQKDWKTVKRAADTCHRQMHTDWRNLIRSEIWNYACVFCTTLLLPSIATCACWNSKCPCHQWKKTPACIREIQVHKLLTKVYSQKGLTATYHVSLAGSKEEVKVQGT